MIDLRNPALAFEPHRSGRAVITHAIITADNVINSLGGIQEVMKKHGSVSRAIYERAKIKKQADPEGKVSAVLLSSIYGKSFQISTLIKYITAVEGEDTCMIDFCSCEFNSMKDIIADILHLLHVPFVDYIYICDRSGCALLAYKGDHLKDEPFNPNTKMRTALANYNRRKASQIPNDISQPSHILGQSFEDKYLTKAKPTVVPTIGTEVPGADPEKDLASDWRAFFSVFTPQAGNEDKAKDFKQIMHRIASGVMGVVLDENSPYHNELPENVYQQFTEGVGTGVPRGAIDQGNAKIKATVNKVDRAVAKMRGMIDGGHFS